MKKIISILLGVLFLTACGTGYTTIDSNKAMELINEGATVVDVRTYNEYLTGFIEGAINIPVDNILSIEAEADDVIIVYCASGVRSAEAAKTLHKEGYTNVYNLDGGLINWGFELVK